MWPWGLQLSRPTVPIPSKGTRALAWLASRWVWKWWTQWRFPKIGDPQNTMGPGVSILKWSHLGWFDDSGDFKKPPKWLFFFSNGFWARSYFQTKPDVSIGFERFTGHHLAGSPLAVLKVEQSAQDFCLNFQFSLVNLLISHTFWGDEPRQHQPTSRMKSSKIRS